MKFSSFVAAAVTYAVMEPKYVAAQGKTTCPTNGQSPFTGNRDYMDQGRVTLSPLRGVTGCIDQGPLSTRPIVSGRDANNIYGPMEAGFTNRQFSCLGNREIPGGIDTLVAELMIEEMCGEELTVLDFCGGHANPYHYHERMTCLYEADPQTGHSTRIGTALDGRGLYGANIDGGRPPTDLDVCGGRFGVTPDSNGQRVYYYVVSEEAPFSYGCFGDGVSPPTVRECRELYRQCGDGNLLNVTSKWGTGLYDLDCPCYDNDGSNLAASVSQGRPGYLNPCRGGTLSKCYARCEGKDVACETACDSTCTHPSHFDDADKEHTVLPRELRRNM